MTVSCRVGIKQYPAWTGLTCLPLVQSMENLYGQGSEGAPLSSEDCDEGESLSLGVQG